MIKLYINYQEEPKIHLSITISIPFTLSLFFYLIYLFYIYHDHLIIYIATSQNQIPKQTLNCQSPHLINQLILYMTHLLDSFFAIKLILLQKPYFSRNTNQVLRMKCYRMVQMLSYINSSYSIELLMQIMQDSKGYVIPINQLPINQLPLECLYLIQITHNIIYCSSPAL